MSKNQRFETARMILVGLVSNPNYDNVCSSPMESKHLVNAAFELADRLMKKSNDEAAIL